MKENDDKHRMDGRSSGEQDGTENWNSLLKHNTFRVPEGYFEELEAVTRFRVGPIGQIALSSDNFPVPAGYFEQMEQEIAARIAEDQLRERVAANNALPVSEGFSVPEGYFSALESRILAQTSVDSSTEKPRMPIVRRMFQPSWLRYATAACVLLVSTLLITNKLKTPAETFNLSGISDQELVQYLQTFSSTQDAFLIPEYAADVEKFDMNLDISSDEIEWYLENTL